MIMSNKEFSKFHKNATRGMSAGSKGFVTYEMMEREYVGHIIEKTIVEPNRILINTSDTHILRRPIR